MAEKKIIAISPGGFKGFYMLGISAYIKENYDLSDFAFSGASAGAWNALLLSYKGDMNIFTNQLLDVGAQLKERDMTIRKIEEIMKEKIMNLTTDRDYDLNKLFIGVSTFDNYKFNINFFTNFKNLEDALDCCISSSHIPFITGKLLHKYNNLYVFDGGFSSNSYLNKIKPVLYITPNLWEQKAPPKKWFKIDDYTTLLSKDKYDIRELFLQGYDDSKKNKHILDKILR